MIETVLEFATSSWHHLKPRIGFKMTLSTIRPDEDAMLPRGVLDPRELKAIIDRMRRHASARLANCPSELAMQTTALVNEAFLRLLRSSSAQQPSSRAYVYATACRAVREAFATIVRTENAQKRGGEWSRVNLMDGVADSPLRRGLDDLHEAIELLSSENMRAATIVDLKFFGGLTFPEIAEALEVSLSTVEADWREARRRLFAMLSEGD